MGTRDCMPGLKPANDNTAPWETPSAFWPAPKMQMSRLVYRKKDASPKLALASISSRCYLSAFPSAVEMQIICARAAMKPPCRQGWANTTLLKGSLVRCSQAYGHQRLHARLKPANDNTASRETPSAFWPAPKMQMSRLVYRKKEASPKLALASISSRCYLSAFPSAVEMQIICARAAMKPPCRQGWANTTLLKGSLVRCSQAYGHQRLHARPEASKWQHSVPGNSICILASSQNADESSGI